MIGEKMDKSVIGNQTECSAAGVKSVKGIGGFKKVFGVLGKALYDYAFLSAGVVTFLLFAVLFSQNDVYPFGKLSISWCDGDQQFIPLLCEFKDILDGKQGFFFSNVNSGGMNFYGVFFFNLSSPFTFLIAFFDKADAGSAFNLIVMLKLITASMTCSFLLKRRTNNYFLVVFPSVVYAFSGYAMMYYQIAQWLDVFYLFPLVLIGLERMTEGRSNLLYIVTLFLTVLFQFYLAYPVVIFLCLYASVCALYNRASCRKFCLSFISGSIVAALLSGVIILPCFMQYRASMRTSGIIETLRGSNFFPSVNTTLPTFYCLAPFVPFIIYFCVKRSRDFKCVVMLLTLFPVAIEPIAKAWQTFNYMSFPTRYGFIVIAFGLYLAVSGAEKLRAESRKNAQNFSENALESHENAQNLSESANLSGTKKFFAGYSLSAKIVYGVLTVALAVLFSIFSVEFFRTNKEALSSFAQSLWGNEISFKGLTIFALFALAAGGAFFAARKFNLTHENVVFGAIALCLVFNSAFSCNVYMIEAVACGKNSNVSTRLETIAELDGLISDDEFYRVKTGSKIFEVNMTGAMGYNGISHYTSLNGKVNMLTAKYLGYSSYWMEVNGNGGTIFSDALLRNKYVIYRGKGGNACVTPSGAYSVSQTRILFPSAFVVKNSAYNPDFSLERYAMQEELFEALTGESGLFEKYSPALVTGAEDLSADGKFVYKPAGSDDADKQAKITYEFTVSGLKRLYFDLFDEYTNALREPTYEAVSEIAVYRNGSVVRRTANYPVRSSNGIVDLGSFSDCTVKVAVTLRKDVSARSFGVFSADEELLKSAVNRLIGADLIVKKNGFSCEIDSQDGGFLFVPVPFDKGFSAKVNGKKRSVGYFGGFMTVPLEKGQNRVELDFCPPGLVFGAVLTTIGFVVFALYLCLRTAVTKDEKIARLYEKSAVARERIGRLSVLATVALGAIVLIVIYVFPVVASLF